MRDGRIPMTQTEDRLDALERRLGAAEDELAIIRLVASYGPQVDCGRTDLAPQLFAPDGVYDVIGARLDRAAFAQMLSGGEHQGVVREGIAHVMGLPWVRVDGDRAIAVNCTQLFHKVAEGFEVFRVAQNVWHLERGSDGWKIAERFNRLIGDDDEARALLERAAIPPATGATP